MSAEPAPTLRLIIDRGALAHNWRVLDEMSGTAEAGAAVKADCYGLGVDACLPALRDAGAREFFVAHWSEVGAVAKHVPPSQIAVLHGPANAQESGYARAVEAVPVINSLHQAKVWSESGGGLCHVMVDTGINRLGLSPNEASDPLIAGLDIDLLMSHLACADEDVPMNARQLASFKDVAAQLSYRRLSLANSAGIALGADYAFDVTRPGLSLYGGVQRPELEQVIRQVASPQAMVMQVRNISAGETVGYNAMFTAAADMRVGVVSLGYADGYLHLWRGKGALEHDGRSLPVLGKVSMDMVVIDLSQASDVREGDWVTVPYSLPHAAQQSTIPQYELLTGLGARLIRA